MERYVVGLREAGKEVEEEEERHDDLQCLIG